MSPQYSGGCRCGSVRYALTARPEKLVLCHCRTCQQLSASGNMAFYHVPTDSFHFTAPSLVPDWPSLPAEHASQTQPAGRLRRINVTSAGTRSFCSVCGTPISMVYQMAPHETAVSVSTLDEVPQGLKVSRHIYVREKAAWEMLPEDGTPRFEILAAGN